MDKVYSIKEAEEWFLNHSEGSVMCVRAEGSSMKELEVETFTEAEKFIGYKK